MVRHLGTQVQFGKGGTRNPEVSGSCAILKKRLNILNYIDRFEKVNLRILLKTLGAQDLL